jgi:maltooligosyltrehalose trehalohydrolase
MKPEPSVSRHRSFQTSWGASLANGCARFRLWAPGAEAVSLRLEGIDTPMVRGTEGWFEHEAAGVAPGATYQYVLADGRAVPDPASRAQAGDVHGPSLVVDPESYVWKEVDWRGRPWEETVLYELHLGTFTQEGTFRAAADRLGHLAALGITAAGAMMASCSTRRIQPMVRPTT